MRNSCLKWLIYLNVELYISIYLYAHPEHRQSYPSPHLVSGVSDAWRMHFIFCQDTTVCWGMITFLPNVQMAWIDLFHRVRRQFHAELFWGFWDMFLFFCAHSCPTVPYVQPQHCFSKNCSELLTRCWTIESKPKPKFGRQCFAKSFSLCMFRNTTTTTTKTHTLSLSHSAKPSKSTRRSRCILPEALLTLLSLGPHPSSSSSTLQRHRTS